MPDTSEFDWTWQFAEVIFPAVVVYHIFEEGRLMTGT